MSEPSTRLGLALPVGTDTVNRADYRENLEKIDAGAALKTDLDTHDGSGGDAHAVATAAAAGFMSAADKAKMDGTIRDYILIVDEKAA
ncbi:MAG: hypothetical protein PHT33_11045, partial [bacterium]|nr:hypothetical protein [bacterium]